jgi:hypothetical protein
MQGCLQKQLQVQHVLGADDMGSFQPGLNFNPVNRAEIVSPLHDKVQLGVS